MRILHVIRTLNPAWGGPVEGLRNLTAQARRRGYEVEVLCADDPESSWLHTGELQIHPVGRGRLRNFGITRKLDDWLGGNLSRFDVIVVHGIWMYFSYAVWKATRRIPVPYFLFIHGALDPWFKRTYPAKHLKKIIYWKLIEHKVLRDAEKVLFTTGEEMALANRSFLPWECKPAITGYGIVRPTLPESFEKGDCLRTLGETYPALANRGIILFLARVQEKKGIDILLKAFAASREHVSGSALVIAGPGEKKTVDDLRDLSVSLGVAEDVVWTGALYGNDKWRIMRAAEVYVLPSHQENFGISVVEALACGLPVLISNKVNIWREIEAMHAGLVAPDDVAGTAGLLQGWAAKTDREKLEMRRSAVECFARNFDIDTTSDRYFALLSSGRATHRTVEPAAAA